MLQSRRRSRPDDHATLAQSHAPATARPHAPNRRRQPRARGVGDRARHPDRLLAPRRPAPGALCRRWLARWSESSEALSRGQPRQPADPACSVLRRGAGRLVAPSRRRLCALAGGVSRRRSLAVRRRPLDRQPGRRRQCWRGRRAADVLCARAVISRSILHGPRAADRGPVSGHEHHGVGVRAARSSGSILPIAASSRPAFFRRKACYGTWGAGRDCSWRWWPRRSMRHAPARGRRYGRRRRSTSAWSASSSGLASPIWPVMRSVTTADRHRGCAGCRAARRTRHRTVRCPPPPEPGRSGRAGRPAGRRARAWRPAPGA